MKFMKRKLSINSLIMNDIEYNLILWKQIEHDEFRIIYIISEVLLKEISYFYKIILNRSNCSFLKNIIDIIINEYHLIQIWVKFRSYYKLFNILKFYISNISFMRLFVILLEDIILYMIKDFCMRNSMIIKKFIRWYNFSLWIISIQ